MKIEIINPYVFEYISQILFLHLTKDLNSLKDTMLAVLY